MKGLTKRVRHVHYKRMLEYFEKHIEQKKKSVFGIHCMGLCRLVYLSLRPLYKWESDVPFLEHYPELMAKRPKRYYGPFWWDTRIKDGGHLKRIRALKKCIEETKRTS